MRFISKLLFLLILTFSGEVYAYNFLYINPTTGKPIAWDNTKTIQYWVDPGPLGGLTNAQALTLVQEAMKIWENASPNANVPKFEFMGFLPEDVDGTNYQKYVSLGQCSTDDLSQCPTQAQKDLKTVIIFDADGSIARNGVCKIGGCSAYSAASVFQGTSQDRQYIAQGIVVLTDSIVPVSQALNATIYYTLGIMTHELGHLLGLGHTVVNQEVYLQNEWEQYKVDVPTMSSVVKFPDTKGTGERDALTLNPDDIAGIINLYPVDPYSPNLATIKGTIKKSDGSQVQLVNVIARNVKDPLCEAYSMLSGRLCPLPLTYISGSCYDNGDYVPVGDFTISGIPPGTYTIETEEVDSSIGPSISPGAVQSLFGDAEFWNEGDVANESNTASSIITVAAGETKQNIDIVLNRNTVTSDRIKSIPLSSFSVGPATACQPSTVNYATLLGLDEPSVADNTNSVNTVSGCNLIR